MGSKSWTLRILAIAGGFVLFVFVLSAALARAAGAPGQEAAAGEKPQVVLEGYVSAIHFPDSFDVNGQPVVVKSTTTYRWAGSKDAASQPAASSDVSPGVWVEVTGTKVEHGVDVDTVSLREHRDRTINGFGLIDKVIAVGTEPVYRLDGYRVRVATSTRATFSGGLSTLADVGPNTWAKYEGKFDKNGDLIATQLAFYPGKAGKKSNPRPLRQEVVVSGQNLLDSEGQFHSTHTKYRLEQMGGLCGWHRVPVNGELQDRVARIGANLVPAFQKQLADDERAKIPFRFYVVDEPQFRFDFGCSPGVVLVPKGVIDRLKSDDQIAAVLADGISAYVEWQSARLVAEYYGIFGIELAGDLAATSVPWAWLSVEGTAAATEHLLNRRFEEQRSRMALGFMADAGYDPWQAPEAWRLLAPKKLPANTSHLKYPSQAGYQLAILNLIYKKSAPTNAAEPGSTANPGPGAKP
jgi:hypothetical protein